MGMLYAAGMLYGLAFLLTILRPRWGRFFVTSGALIHLFALAGRGWVIGFFPLTGKMESFSVMALSFALVAALTWYDNDRRFGLAMLTLVLASMATSLRFPLDMRYPPPLMWTIWYPLHVPLAFFAYAIWGAAAAAALCWLKERDRIWLLRIDQLALQGFGLWSLSMICGGVWGVLAWGAYFLWDPKVIWSVLLWFHYASFVHLRLTPSLLSRPWVRPLLAALGLLWVFVAYVGTSFFFGGSSHAF